MKFEGGRVQAQRLENVSARQYGLQRRDENQGDGVCQVGVGAGMGFASRRGRWEEEGKREDERVSNRLIEGDVRTRDSSREG
jgi:hypothetical protein